MQEHLKQEPKSLQKALEQKEQLEARIANERSKYAADLRTAQSRHKHMIGGAGNKGMSENDQNHRTQEPVGGVLYRRHHQACECHAGEYESAKHRTGC